MKHYQEQLLSLLHESGWELAVRDDDTEWWSAEQWTIKSLRESWGEELLINFLVDPQYEGLVKHSAVWAVSASIRQPQDRIEAQEGIATMDLVKGKYESKLKSFVSAINRHRHCQVDDV